MSPGRSGVSRAAAVLCIVLSSCIDVTAWRPWANLPATRTTRLADTVPTTRGSAGGSCDLCARNWLLIIGGGGRTGSTTARSMFSGVPGFLINGEHRGVLLYERSYFEEALKANAHIEAGSSAWAGHPFNRHKLLCEIQQRIQRFILDSDSLHGDDNAVIGFKEVRYATAEMLHFLSEVFPCARFVFTYRSDPDANINMKIKMASHEIWQNATALITAVHKALPRTTALLPVEDQTPGRYSSILTQLGVKGCHFRDVVHSNSKGGYTKADEDSLEALEALEGRCDLSEVDFVLDPSDQRRNSEQLARLAVLLNGTAK